MPRKGNIVNIFLVCLSEYKLFWQSSKYLQTVLFGVPRKRSRLFWNTAHAQLSWEVRNAILTELGDVSGGRIFGELCEAAFGILLAVRLILSHPRRGVSGSVRTRKICGDPRRATTTSCAALKCFLGISPKALKPARVIL